MNTRRLREQARDRELLRTLRHRVRIIQAKIKQSGGNISLFKQLEQANRGIDNLTRETR